MNEISRLWSFWLIVCWTGEPETRRMWPRSHQGMHNCSVLEGQEVHYFDRTLLCRAHEPVSISPWLSYASTSVTCSADPLLIINQWNKAACLLLVELLLREEAHNTTSASDTDTNRYAGVTRAAPILWLILWFNGWRILHLDRGKEQRRRSCHKTQYTCLLIWNS